MLDPQPLINQVSSYLKSCLTAELMTSGHIASVTLPIREINLRLLPIMDGDWLFWDRPDDNETILGLGNILNITASGTDRFEALSRKLQQTHNNWNWLDPDKTGCKPLCYLCFAFNPEDQMTGAWGGLPNSSLSLPELTIQQKNNSCVAIFSVDLRNNREPEAIHQHWTELFAKFLEALNQQYPSPGCKTSLTRITTSATQDQWRQLIFQAQDSIASSTMEKVVPARRLRVQAERKLNPRQLMSALGYLYPNSILLACRIGDRTFVSATPERLLSTKNGEICCDAIAGTIHRSATEKKDRDLGQLLLSDPKARHEHQLVVQDINRSLDGICSEIEYLKQPSLLRLRHLQHLHTEIRGRLMPDITLLEAATRLHPTAAINGYPGPEAKRWLMQNEPIDRGWYAGAAGWIDHAGDGKLAVLLRCALLDNNQADLFAGAGITAESEPDAEYRETELKFRVMLEALENA